MSRARDADEWLVQASFASQASVDPLRASAERAAEAALHELPEALVLAFDERLRVERVAGPAQARVGGAEEGAGGRPLAEVFAEHAWRRIEPLARSALRGETRSREIWTSEHGHCLTVDVGPLQGARADVARAAAGGIALVLDATARRRAEMLRGDGDGAPVGTGLLDMEDRWVLANRALCDITGYTADELIGKRFEGIVHPDDAGSDRRLRERLLTGELPAYRVEKRCFDAAGETVSTIMSLALVRAGDGTPLHYVAQVRDVSERRRLEEDLRGLGDHDPLTGVRNRRLFGHDLRLQLARCRRYGEVAGLMVVELQVAGARGEQALERVVGAAARALTRRLRETDLIARVDAERFAVLLAHVDEEGLAVVAESVQRVIAGCAVEIGDDVVHPSARVGFVLLDERERGAEQALERVEQALRGAA